MFECAPGTVLEDSDGDRWEVGPEGQLIDDCGSECVRGAVENRWGPLKVVSEPPGMDFGALSMAAVTRQQFETKDSGERQEDRDLKLIEGMDLSTGLYTTKDSGKRQVYSTGMRRDVSTDKPRFDLLIHNGVPYEHQFLTRLANLMMRGAEKYDARNWENANTEIELQRFQESAFRHFMQWINGETDEDHMAAVCFNLMAYEMTAWKMAHYE